MGDRASADSFRWNLDLILDQRGADTADLPGGAGARATGREPDRLVTRIDPGVFSLLAGGGHPDHALYVADLERRALEPEKALESSA